MQKKVVFAAISFCLLLLSACSNAETSVQQEGASSSSSAKSTLTIEDIKKANIDIKTYSSFGVSSSFNFSR